jgi:8-hydroxy-5-deazaflavin:NADPH oxidoreductase
LSTMPNVFLSGNDPIAKAKVSSLLEDFGWPNTMIEDLGGVHTARGPESFMHFVPSLIAAHGFTPFALTIAR